MAEARTKATTKKTATKSAAADSAASKPAAKKTPAVKAVAPKSAPAITKKAAAPKKATATAAKAKPAAVKTTTPRKSGTTTKTRNAAPRLSDEQRYRMIAEAAYYRAESCQFKSDPVRDWIEAERDIAILLSEAK